MANKQNDIKPVSIRLGDDGKPMGVRIRALDEDFTIALNDTPNKYVGIEVRENYQLPTKKQALLICAYLDDVQSTLKEAGGDVLNGVYLTCADYYANGTWSFNSTYGCLFSYTRYYHGFRSRPVLA